MSQEYSAGFISGSEHLYRFEIKQILSLLNQGLTKEQIREKALRENLLQQKSYKANVVLLRKVFNRIEHLDDRLCQFVLNGTNADIHAILLYAYLKSYRFLQEFAYEVVIYRYELGRHRITATDIREFFERKEEQSLKVRNFTPQTKQKMRQVMLKAMIEAEWLYPRKTDWEIRPLPISEELKAYTSKQPQHRLLVDIALTGRW